MHSWLYVTAFKLKLRMFSYRFFPCAQEIRGMEREFWFSKGQDMVPFADLF